MTFEKPQQAPENLSARLSFHLERAKMTYWPLALKWGKKNKKTLAYGGFLLCLAIGLLILQSTLGSNASRDASDWDSTGNDSIQTPVLDGSDIDNTFEPPAYEDEEEQQEDTPNDDTVKPDEDKVPETPPDESETGNDEQETESEKPSTKGTEEKNDTASKEKDEKNDTAPKDTEEKNDALPKETSEEHGATPVEEEEEPKAEAEKAPWNSVRLPPWQVPTHYDLDM
jgi:hypothetical protein